MNRSRFSEELEYSSRSPDLFAARHVLTDDHGPMGGRLSPSLNEYLMMRPWRLMAEPLKSVHRPASCASWPEVRRCGGA